MIKRKIDIKFVIKPLCSSQKGLNTTPIQARPILYFFLFLSFLFCFAASNYATEKDHRDGGSQGRKQGKITDYFNRPTVKPKLNSKSLANRIPTSTLPTVRLKPGGTVNIDLTKDSPAIETRSSLTSIRPDGRQLELPPSDN